MSGGIRRFSLEVRVGATSRVLSAAFAPRAHARARCQAKRTGRSDRPHAFRMWFHPGDGVVSTETRSARVDVRRAAAVAVLCSETKRDRLDPAPKEPRPFAQVTPRRGRRRAITARLAAR